MILEKLELLTANLQATKLFYQEVLELQLVEDKQDTFTVQAGATRIRFEATEGYNCPFYHFALNIPENQFREAKSWIQSRVPLIQEEGDDEVFFTSWNAHSVYFEDPSGNIVEFIARHNLSNAISHSFHSGEINGVSEIGVVVDEVIPFVRALNKIGLPNWKEDSEGLTPVGDEHGLFIVVKKGRTWFFSNQKPAEYYPLRVSIQGIGRLAFAGDSTFTVIEA
ncbi:ring-cleaving dioxygenase [Paenibacillus sp. GM2]|uniref:ring-cleaving dioxygenase n=1 Tax=Paenibacillus sp. GM2 TaxID=1622070 RepID=UPI0008385C80|nr:ring-cleaving dioxygenase [Paenibacillus sp. GM2]